MRSPVPNDTSNWLISKQHTSQYINNCCIVLQNLCFFFIPLRAMILLYQNLNKFPNAKMYWLIDDGQRVKKKETKLWRDQPIFIKLFSFADYTNSFVTGEKKFTKWIDSSNETGKKNITRLRHEFEKNQHFAQAHKIYKSITVHMKFCIWWNEKEEQKTRLKFKMKMQIPFMLLSHVYKNVFSIHIT